ncbi:MAG: hypothetical protein K9N35_05460 [Candidatus Marinimicrobia bacterium]|nr:hypothetical protein [Candidatus Neomarinimicrobiota bacterium]
MSSLILLLFLAQVIYGQGEDLTQNEVDEPDEGSYHSILLKQLFDPLEISTADSMDLLYRNFPPKAIELILFWQHLGCTSAGYKELQRLWRSDFPALPPRKTSGTSMVSRQRIQYNAASDAWRILHKSRIKNESIELTFLIEQDPGESKISDHLVASISSTKIPGTSRFIAGDFNISWGGGLILDQNASRPSMSPGSLTSTLRIQPRPHYSSRETNYFRGIASVWEFSTLNLAAFISSRQAIGQISDDSFKEDSDGIHFVGKSYDYKYLSDIGAAATYEQGSLKLLIASHKSHVSDRNIDAEWGVQYRFAESQMIQLFWDNFNLSRALLNWSYNGQYLRLSAQYRQFKKTDSSQETQQLTLLGQQSASEGGISFRLLVKPLHGVNIQYALDQASAMRLTSLANRRRLIIHKAQIYFHQGSWRMQFDWSQKNDGPLYDSQIWQDIVHYNRINKLAVSLDESVTSQVRYRINIKTAANQNERSFLLQQRMAWFQDSWRIAAGHVRYLIPASSLRLSVYESGLAESFNFFTAFQDGQHWYLYCRYTNNELSFLEIQFTQTDLYSAASTQKSPSFHVQLSIVL